MEKEKEKVIIAGLLHDIGKVIRRGTNIGEHSKVGADFLDELKFDKEITQACRYHHGEKLKSAHLNNDHIAHIIYIADNISASADRRYIEGDEDNENNKKIFNEHICLKSVFNKLNQNNLSLGYSDFYYKNPKQLIIPSEYSLSDISKGKYIELTKILEDNLKNHTNISINSYLELIEGVMSFVPSCTAENDTNDISLYDHSKITAGLACAIYDYLKENNINDYKKHLLKNEKAFNNEKVFLLATFDISGIQNFIYNVKSENALKQLRARSIYIDLLSENLIDEILQKNELSRTNVIYNGGGNAYIILPNTEKAKKSYNEVIKKQNNWFLKIFREKLYVTGAFVECSANELCNKDQEEKITDTNVYGKILQRLANEISKNKLSRFDAEQINFLNNDAFEASEECSVCGLNIKTNQCICSKMATFGKDILTRDIFVFTDKKIENGINLDFFSLTSGDIFLNLFNEKEFENFPINNLDNITKIYAKNDYKMGEKYYGKLYIGDHFAKTRNSLQKSFDNFENESVGIKRIAVLKADIDDLSIAFKNGFESKYATLSRFSTLSMMLSKFFKFHINEILESNKYQYNIFKNKNEAKNISIIYSGGDDLCVVGSWNDVIECALLIRNIFKDYCGNTLSISAGIGLYKSGYPMSKIANEVENFKDVSKNQKNKNSITLFCDDENGTFYWEDFENNVISKYKLIENFFDKKSEKFGSGKAFIYNLIDLLRNHSEKRPQIAYLLARLLDDKDNIIHNSDKELINNVFEWSKSKKSTKELIMALTLYVYSIREEV